MNLFVATLDTTHFSFLGVGRTRGLAKAALIATTEQHCKQHEMSHTMFYETWGDAINYASVLLDERGARDGELL